MEWNGDGWMDEWKILMIRLYWVFYFLFSKNNNYSKWDSFLLCYSNGVSVVHYSSAIMLNFSSRLVISSNLHYIWAAHLSSCTGWDYAIFNHCEITLALVFICCKRQRHRNDLKMHYKLKQLDLWILFEWNNIHPVIFIESQVSGK